MPVWVHLHLPQSHFPPSDDNSLLDLNVGISVTRKLGRCKAFGPEIHGPASGQGFNEEDEAWQSITALREAFSEHQQSLTF